MFTPIILLCYLETTTCMTSSDPIVYDNLEDCEYSLRIGVQELLKAKDWNIESVQCLSWYIDT
jgi:hypothetical protein